MLPRTGCQIRVGGLAAWNLGDQRPIAANFHRVVIFTRIPADHHIEELLVTGQPRRRKHIRDIRDLKVEVVSLTVTDPDIRSPIAVEISNRHIVGARVMSSGPLARWIGILQQGWRCAIITQK